MSKHRRLRAHSLSGSESNWLETVPGKGFYPFFRFYGLKESVFDGTWKLPDVEFVK